jgi:hypothetical protein
MIKARPLLCAKKGVFVPIFAVLSFLIEPHFLNRSMDLVRSLFSSKDIGPYILPTYRPLSTFLGPFGGAQMPQNSRKKLFSGWFGLFLLQEWAYGFGYGLFFKVRYWAIHPAHLSVFQYFFGTIWGCPNAPKQYKNYFLGVLDPFFIQEWAY